LGEKHKGHLAYKNALQWPQRASLLGRDLK